MTRRELAPSELQENAPTTPSDETHYQRITLHATSRRNDKRVNNNKNHKTIVTVANSKRLKTTNYSMDANANFNFSSNPPALIMGGHKNSAFQLFEFVKQKHQTPTRSNIRSTTATTTPTPTFTRPRSVTFPSSPVTPERPALLGEGEGVGEGMLLDNTSYTSKSTYTFPTRKAPVTTSAFTSTSTATNNIELCLSLPFEEQIAATPPPTTTPSRPLCIGKQQRRILNFKNKNFGHHLPYSCFTSLALDDHYNPDRDCNHQEVTATATTMTTTSTSGATTSSRGTAPAPATSSIAPVPNTATGSSIGSSSREVLTILANPPSRSYSSSSPFHSSSYRSPSDVPRIKRRASALLGETTSLRLVPRIRSNRGMFHPYK